MRKIFINSTSREQKVRFSVRIRTIGLIIEQKIANGWIVFSGSLKKEIKIQIRKWILMYELIGYAGMILVLVSFALSRNHYPRSQLTYVLASILLGIYAIITWTIPYLILNVIAGLISLYNLLKVRGEGA